MPWFEDLQLEGNGSFRGVEFHVESMNSTIGRRTVVHEFPGADKPFVEDLGRRAREFQVTAYVLGNEYMVGRDLLREAAETAGPGQLVHPYWGEFKVTVVGGVQIRETPKEGGLARITFNVVEAGDELETTQPDLVAIVELKVDLANLAIIESFADIWTVVGFINAVVQGAINAINSVASSINQIKGYVNAVMATIDSVGDAITAVTDGVSDLILAPAALAASLQGVVNDLLSGIASIGDAWDSYFDDDEEPGAVAGTPSTSPTGASPASGDKRADVMMKTFRELLTSADDFPVVPFISGSTTERTPQRAQEKLNQDSLKNLMKQLTVTESCRGVTKIPFSSLNKANEVRDEILVAMDEQIETAADVLYGPLVDLRVAFVQYLQSASAELPRVVEFTPATTLPALVIAQQIYGDSRREGDILSRNGVRNPNKVPGGQVLEVISDD